MAEAPITADRFPELLPSAPEASAAWNVASAYLFAPPRRVSMSCADHLVSVLFSGTCRFRQDAYGRTMEAWTGPGAVQLLPARFEGTWEGRERAGKFRALAIFIPEAFLARVIAQDFDRAADQVEIIQQFNERDPVIEGLFQRLADDATSGYPFGAIYAESACEFLAHHIIHAHSSLTPRRHRAGGLPARHLKRALDYIEEHLAESITLRELAELGDVSPRHFERAFRQSLGTPLHAFVIQKRVAAARALLVSDASLSIREIAVRVGFCSSSHMAAAFRRQTGQSPSEFRRH